MRTTLNLPDELYRQVKHSAVDQGRTVTSLVEEALAQLVATRPPTRAFAFADIALDLGHELEQGTDWGQFAHDEEVRRYLTKTGSNQVGGARGDAKPMDAGPAAGGPE
ncbi:MAG: hypothetical protein LBK95_17410 [Bifidobacteriaceae bacterium]|nr:hypothetical protein [Bifidobacteriaceae bacterium]